MCDRSMTSGAASYALAWSLDPAPKPKQLVEYGETFHFYRTVVVRACWEAVALFRSGTHASLRGVAESRDSDSRTRAVMTAARLGQTVPRLTMLATIRARETDETFQTGRREVADCGMQCSGRRRPG